MRVTVYIDTGRLPRMVSPVDEWVSTARVYDRVSIDRESIDKLDTKAKSFILDGYKFIVIEYNIPRQQFDVMLDSPLARLIRVKVKTVDVYWRAIYAITRKLLDWGVISIEPGSTEIKWGRK